MYFLAESKWDDRAVRLHAAGYALDVLLRRGPVTAWIIDDTGLLKQGKHSVGVQRQYTGSAGKVTNCQLGVSLCAATEHEHIPLDFELYLPEQWLEDRQRRVEAHIPDDAIFQTKTELALGMMERAVQAGLPGKVVLADSAYGDSTTFRNTVRYLWNKDFAVGVGPSLKVVRLDCHNRPGGKGVAIGDLSTALTRKGFRKYTWRNGSRAKMSSSFHFVRVKTTHDDGIEMQDREPLWLLIEWPDGESRPTKYALTTLPTSMSKKEIIRLLKERWRTERMYQDLKGELGLDHFEGRSFPGWQHPRFGRHVLLRLHRCRALALFSPLGQTVPTFPFVRRRGLNATSPTPSSQFDWRSRNTSPVGFPVARYVINVTPSQPACSAASRGARDPFL